MCVCAPGLRARAGAHGSRFAAETTQPQPLLILLSPVGRCSFGRKLALLLCPICSLSRTLFGGGLSLLLHCRVSVASLTLLSIGPPTTCVAGHAYADLGQTARLQSGADQLAAHRRASATSTLYSATCMISPPPLLFLFISRRYRASCSTPSWPPLPFDRVPSKHLSAMRGPQALLCPSCSFPSSIPTLNHPSGTSTWPLALCPPIMLTAPPPSSFLFLLSCRHP